MARGTLRRRMFPGERKCRQRVIERGRAPGGCRMAGLTIMTVVPRHMIGICRQLEITLMTLVTA